MSQDYCYNKEEDKAQVVKCRMNTRYPYFKQNIYTAGDFEQFLEHWKVLPRGRDVMVKHQIDTITIPNIDFEKYQNLCIHDYYNTFLYIHEKFKKGCFIQFHDKALKTFLHFSKAKF